MTCRIVSLVLVGSAVASAIAWFALFGSSRVAQMRSVTYKQTNTFRTTESPRLRSQTSRNIVLADGRCRTDLSDGGYNIMDMKAAKSLYVSPPHKSAMIMVGMNVPAGVNMYDMIRNAAKDAAKRLPDEMIDGRKTQVVLTEFKNREARSPLPMKVWVDPDTQLPVRMESVPQDGHEGPPTSVLFDFAYDQPVDLSLFNLDPPEGYTVTTEGVASLPAPPDEPELRAPRVIPGVGLGPVKFGMSEDEVIAILGKPDWEGHGDIKYLSRGYGFAFRAEHRLVSIQCFSQEEEPLKVRDFAGKTKQGIGIGSSRKDLEKAFGKPDRVEPIGPAVAKFAIVNYNKLGWQLMLFSDKVVSFVLQAPRPETEAPNSGSTK